MIVADIEVIKLERRWRTSAGCTDATAARSIAFCRAYRKLEAELAGATRAEYLRSELARLAPLITAATTERAVTNSNAAAQAVAQWLHIDLAQVISAQVLILAIVLEIAGAAIPGTAARRQGPSCHLPLARLGTAPPFAGLRCGRRSVAGSSTSHRR